MFDSLQQAPPDPILGLTEAFNADSNPEKINLSVGVYKDESGKTPVLECVKEAERRLLKEEQSKGYLGIDGLADYTRHVKRMLLGDLAADRAAAVVQSPGGTGAVRLASDFIKGVLSGDRIWVSNPTWANHNAIFQASGLSVETYPYLDDSKTQLDFSAMCQRLEAEARAGDAVLLHACCHNPSGVDLTVDQWSEIGALLRDKSLLPVLDFAYQGFGEGLEEDAVGLRRLLESCPELLIANSYSKNFGLYSERVGALTVVAREDAQAKAVLSQLKRLARANWSNPPRHGAAIVATILDDAELRRRWEAELSTMRQRIAAMRVAFVEGMRKQTKEHDFSFLQAQKGMFSFSGLSPLQVDRLRSEYSIYIVGSGRINVAGITPDNVDRLCQAVNSVL